MKAKQKSLARNAFSAVWNARINEERHAEAEALCAEAGLKKSDLARLSLELFLDLYRAAGGRLLNAVERQAVLAAAAEITRRATEAAQSLQS